MTKGFLERERAGLKADMGMIYNRATAVKRLTSPTELELRALFQEIESIALRSLITVAANDSRRSEIGRPKSW